MTTSRSDSRSALNRQITTNLVAYMQDLDCTKTDLSRGARITPARLMQLMDGLGRWQLDEVARCVWYLGYSLDDFLAIAGVPVRVSEQAAARHLGHRDHRGPNTDEKVMVP